MKRMPRLLAIVFAAALAQRAALAVDDVSPEVKRVTLHCKNAPAAEVLDNLCKQMGVEYSTFPVKHDNWAPVTLDAEDRPYWEVADELSKAWHVGFCSVRGKKLLVMRDNVGTSRMISGPMMFGAQTIKHDINQNKPEGQQHESSMLMWLSWEPQLNVAAFRCGPADVALDENGRSWTVQSRPGYIQYPLTASAQTTKVPLGLGSEAGRKLTLVRGTAWLFLLEKSTTVEIAAAEFGTPTTVKVGGTTAELTVEQGGTSALKARVARGNLGDKEFEEACDLVGGLDLVVEDANGLTVSRGMMWWSRGDQARTMTINFPSMTRDLKKVGAPVRCRIVVPLEWKRMVVPYEFKDLPLP